MRKKIISSLLVVGLLAMQTTSAMYGNGNSYGKNNKSFNKGGNMSIENIEKSDLSSLEQEKLIYQYSEEMLARDMYNYFYELYGTQVFKNIASSEQKHMDSVKMLLDRYGIDAPTDFGELEDEYETLKEKGSNSLLDALEVGVQIEILDIEDIVKTIKLTDNDDIKLVFYNIGGASYNHMRGFLKALDQNNLETNIDYSYYLEESDINTKGPLKEKILSKLEGIELPENINNKKTENKKVKNNKREVKGLSIKTKNAIDNSVQKIEKSFSKYDKTTKVMKYELVKSKLEKELEKINNLNKYSEEKKELYKNIINEILNSIDEIIYNL